MYDCLDCPGYCCSYPLIILKKKDVKRLAEHFEMSFEDAQSKFTEQAHGEKYTMRRKKDVHFGKICRFFDTEERRCSIYKARPKVCREYPNTKRCGYYDFLAAERIAQEDPEYVATTHHA